MTIVTLRAADSGDPILDVLVTRARRDAVPEPR